MNKQTLRFENRRYQATRGVSENNSDEGFRPAFLDKETGRIELPRQRDGEIAAMHIISWLPREWATAFACDGSVLSLKDQVIAGFVRDDIFYTRAQVAEL